MIEVQRPFCGSRPQASPAGRLVNEHCWEAADEFETCKCTLSEYVTVNRLVVKFRPLLCQSAYYTTLQYECISEFLSRQRNVFVAAVAESRDIPFLPRSCLTAAMAELPTLHSRRMLQSLRTLVALWLTTSL
ncbi:hypothetical protein BaRGS_00013065 [Batillaria attramentaria]|uniref:Uncharacterized protein n=1 Tax=Batillaria attramentaria TaxID=370345 RepID=A0ABD0L8L0_9CAEN